MGTMWTYKYEFYKVGFTLLQRQNDLRIYLNITAVLNLAGLCDIIIVIRNGRYPKILVLRLPQHTSNVNTECAGKLKQLYSLCDLEHWYTWFYYSDINLILIDYAWCKVCNIWLLLCENNSNLPSLIVGGRINIGGRHFISNS